MSDVGYREAIAAPGLSPASVRDFWQLMKPRVMSLVVFTALAGLVAAPGPIHPVIALIAIVAIAAGGGAAGALNMWYERDIDSMMSRTAGRPIPSGRIMPEEALGFALVLAIFSVLTLGMATNWIAGGLLAFTIFFYAVPYTMWLKRATAQNIVIGGAAGAFPPMIGWAAVTGSVGIESAVLFAIIFMWTPPHFWALALAKNADYTRAGVPMLPVTAGETETRRQILIYTALLVPVTLLPNLLGFASWLYLAAAVAGGGWMLWLAADIWRKREGRPAVKACWAMFGFSILYLFGLFAALLLEKLAARAGFPF
jgi:protoheme IX farnesyltransferase